MPSVLSIDEVYVPTDDRNKYLCILFDFETKMIIDVLPSRHKNVLSAYFHSVPLDERKMLNICHPICGYPTTTYQKYSYPILSGQLTDSTSLWSFQKI